MISPGRADQAGVISVMAANQTNFRIESIIYDPQSGNLNQSLPVTLSIAGFYDANSSVEPQPSWLQFFVPQSLTNLSITPYDPLYFDLGYAMTSAAPLGSYTVVVNVQIGGENLLMFTPNRGSPRNIFCGISLKVTRSGN